MFISEIQYEWRFNLLRLNIFHWASEIFVPMTLIETDYEILM